MDHKSSLLDLIHRRELTHKALEDYMLQSIQENKSTCLNSVCSQLQEA